MLRPGADVVDDARRARTGSWPGDGHVLTDRGGFQVFSLEPKVDDDGGDVPVDLRRQHATTSAPRARWRCRSSSAPTSRWCSTCARRCPRRTRWCAPRSSAPPSGPSGRGPRSRRRGGRADRGWRRPSSASSRAASTRAAGRERPADGRRSASTATPSAACRWARRRDEMLPALAADPRRAARRPAPLPHGRRRPGRAWSRRSASASTCSTACCPPATARHGTVLTDAGRLNLRNARFATDDGPAGPGVPLPGVRPLVARATCATCCQVGEQAAARLVTIHNVAWTSASVGPHGGRRSGPGTSRRGEAEIVAVWG